MVSLVLAPTANQPAFPKVVLVAERSGKNCVPLCTCFGAN